MRILFFVLIFTTVFIVLHLVLSSYNSHPSYGYKIESGVRSSFIFEGLYCLHLWWRNTEQLV